MPSSEHTKSKEEKRLWFGQLFLAIVLLGVSTTTTTGGVMSLLRGALPEPLLIPAAAGLAGMISLTIYVAYTSFMHRATPGAARPFFLVLGIAASLLSLVTEAALFNVMFNKDELQRRADAREIVVVAEPVKTFVNELVTVSGLFDEASSDATIKALVESTQGGTCEGQKPYPNICGPRCRFRQRLAREASEHAESLRAVAEEGRGILLSTGSIASDGEWNQVYADAGALGASSGVESARLWTRRTLQEFKSDFFDERSKRRYSCSDGEAVAQLSALSTAIDRPLQLPSSPPVREPVTFTDVGRAMVASLGRAASAFGRGLGVEDMNTLRLSAPSLVIASFIEIAVATLLFASNARPVGPRRPRGVPRLQALIGSVRDWRKNAREEWHWGDLGSDLEPSERFSREAIADTIQRCLMSLGSRRYFVVPLDAADRELTRRAMWLVARLRLKPWRAGTRPINPYTANILDMISNIETDAPGTRQVQVFKPSRELEAYWRDLILSTGPGLQEVA